MSRNLRVVVPGLPEGSDRPMVTSCYSWEAVVWSSLSVWKTAKFWTWVVELTEISMLLVSWLVRRGMSLE